MFAVIRTGGKQYKVEAGDCITVERITGNAGDNVTFDDVLMVGDEKKQTVGTPTVKGAKVAATVLEQARGPKIIVFKKKRRKGYRRKNGHRQDVTVLRVGKVTGAASRAKKAEAAEAEED